MTASPPPPRPAVRPRRRGRRIGLAVAAGFSGLVGVYEWQIQPGRFFGTVPLEIAPVETTGPHRVFTYATLTSPAVRFAVMGRAGAGAPAVLPGHRREGRDVLPDPEAEVAGYTILVSTEELVRLDRYERVGLRYARTEMLLADGQPAWVYRRLDP